MQGEGIALASDHQDQDRLIVDLCQEFATRLRRGEAPIIAEYVQDFPQVAQEIQNLFPVLETEVQSQESRVRPG
jgi:hypothetical protein